MAGHITEELLVSNLLLDVENPRHDVLANQRDALKEMMDVQGEKLVKLAGDIVIPHKDEKKKYIVLEGNRRITAFESGQKSGQKPYLFCQADVGLPTSCQRI